MILVLITLLLVLIYLIIRILYQTSIVNISKNWVTYVQDRFHTHNIYKIPQYNEFSQENLLFRKISTYLKSLPSVEDSDYAALYSGDKSGDVLVSLGPNQTVVDTFLDVRVTWTYQNHGQGAEIILRVKSRDKKRVLAPYIQHIYKVVDEIELRKKELRIYLNNSRNGTWESFPFVHPSSFETVWLDNEVKNRVRNDLELYLKSKQYYGKTGRVWRRSYLLYGGSGTGKSSFVAAMAKMLSYDLYDLDLSNVVTGSDLKTLLMKTGRKSVILVENLDLFLMGGSSSVSLTAVMGYMDGVVSGCGDERVMVFTMNCKNHIDPIVLRPGRVDVHIYFPFCDYNGFKALALSHLGVTEHKLFGRVEELFQGGSRLISPAAISEIMISNRTSASRAIKSIIKTLQNDSNKENTTNDVSNNNNRNERERGSGDSDGSGSGSGNKREGNIAMREIQKLYGIMKLRNSRRQESL